MDIQHSFTSTKSDGGDATLVKPSDWNDSHVITGGPLAFYQSDNYPPTFNAVTDEFDDSSLDGAWTWTTSPTGTVSESEYPGYLFFDAHTSDNTRHLRRSFVPGANTAFTVAMKVIPAATNDPGNFRIGVEVLESNDTQIYPMSLYNQLVSAQSQRRIFANATGVNNTSALSTPIYLLFTRDTSNVYNGYWSPDGIAWNFIGTNTISTTVSKVGIEFVGTSGKQTKVLIDFVRVFDSVTFKIGA